MTNKPHMKLHTLALNHGGNMQFVLDIKATTLGKARHEWARLTGHLDGLWNEAEGTYFGWPVVETTQKALQRKEIVSFLGY